MRNIVGQTPRGEDFFKRDRLINSIYRRLEAGENIFLSAPRRAGKTSIMRYLEDHPQEGYAFIYINTEDITNSEDFFKVVTERLLDSDAVKRMTKLVESSKNIFSEITEKISKVKVWQFELELKKEEPPTYREIFNDLMRKLNAEKYTIVMMLDEFPITLENIHHKYSQQDAVQFLHINRSIRQQAGKGIQFIYTGSVGLRTIAERLKATNTLNDLNMLEIPPFSREEAQSFTKTLLENYNVQYEADAIDYMLDTLQWLMPFFIQLIVQILIDQYELTGKFVDKQMIDKAFEMSSSHRSNLYFESYYSRLEKSLPEDDAMLAKEFLRRIAHEHEVSVSEYKDDLIASRVLEMLELDGYINSDNNHYRFNSPILRDWWKKYAN